MFKRVVSDTVETTDVGSVIKPGDYDKVDSGDYVMHEDDEKIYFLIKSKTDEYCFTNKAMIHIDGATSSNQKRLLKRLDYKSNQLREIRLETINTFEMEIEINVTVGKHSYSIDVNKKHIEELKDLYKALTMISSIQDENAKLFQLAQNSLETAATTVNSSFGSSNIADQFKAVNEYAFYWIKEAHDTYIRKDFSEVFEKLIKN